MSTEYLDGVYQEDLMVGTDVAETNAPSGGIESVTQVGIHSLAVGQLAYETAWTPGTIAAGASATKTITVAGAALQDFVMRSFSLDTQGLTLTADVTAENTVTAVLANLTGSSKTIAAGTLRVVVLKART